MHLYFVFQWLEKKSCIMEITGTQNEHNMNWTLNCYEKVNFCTTRTSKLCLSDRLLMPFWLAFSRQLWRPNVSSVMRGARESRAAACCGREGKYRNPAPSLVCSLPCLSVYLHWFLSRLFLAPADWSRGRRRTSIMLLLVVVGEGEGATVNMEDWQQ